MFGSGKKGGEPIVGARKKLEQARNYQKKYGNDFDIKSKREGKEPNPALAIVVVWAMAVGLAALMSNSIYKSGMGVKTDTPIGKLLFGPGDPSFGGSPDVDRLIVMLGRGTILFLLAGLVPLFSLMWQQVIDRAQLRPHLAVWASSITLAIIYFAGKEFLGQSFKEALEGMF